MGAHLMFANAIHFVVWSSDCSTTAESKLADSNYYSWLVMGVFSVQNRKGEIAYIKKRGT
jgi:hypothetical protein